MAHHLADRLSVRRVLLVVLLLLVVWFVLGAIQLFQVRSEAAGVKADMRVMQQEVDQVRAAVDQGGNPDLEATAGRLTKVLGTVRSLESGLDSPLVWPYRVVPGVSRQVGAARHLATASVRLAEAGNTLVTGVRQVESADDAAGRTAGYRRLATGAVALRTAAHTDLGPSSFLLPPLRTARAQAADLLGQVKEPADALAEGVPGAVGFLTGSHDYLLLSSNNTESGGFSGRYLQVGWLRARGGGVHVDQLRDSSEASEWVKPGAVPITDTDWARNWGWLQPSSLWTELGTTSRFPLTAQTAAKMWSVRTGGEKVDGVASIDIKALVDVVKGSGGTIEFRGKQLDADQVQQYLLTDQYFITDFTQRRKLLAELTDKVLGTIQSSERTNVFGLIRALRGAVEGRHLMMWSASEDEQRAWDAMGAAGVPAPDGIQIGTSTLLSKLDHKLQFTVTGSQREEGDGRTVQLNIAMHNTATGQEPAYLFASPEAVGREEGDYAGFLMVDLPGTATDVAIDGPPNVDGPDGRQTQVSTFVEVPAGETRTTRVRFHLPAGAKVVVEPSARIPAMQWKLGSSVKNDDKAFSTSLDSWAPLTGPGPEPVTDAQAKAALAKIDAGLGPLAKANVDQLAALVISRAPSTNRGALTGDDAFAGLKLPDLLTLVATMGQKRYYDQLLGVPTG